MRNYLDKNLLDYVDEEIERLNAVRALLLSPSPKGTQQKRPTKRTMSPKARKAIAAAQKKRWAEHKKNQQPTRAA